MDLHKLLNKLLLIVFVSIIIVPLATTKFSGGEISEKEKRTLAEIPSAENLVERIFNREFMQDVENWLNDHIGKRNGCRTVYAILMYHGLNISTSEDVVLGQKGYCFFTRNSNLDIAKGNYPLTDDDLRLMRNQYEKVKDYYSERGTRFFLSLTPSKVSVYPEYLPFEIDEEAVQPSEIVESAINDPLHVINIKSKMISSKNEGKLFFLTDSHWNQRGTYKAYEYLLKRIKPKEAPIEGNYKTSKRTGDLYQELGLIKKRDMEEEPVFVYEWRGRKLGSNEIDREFVEVLKQEFEAQETVYTEPEIFVNDSISEGTMVIYGDSMMAGYLKIPKYFSEHYNKVVVLRLRKISKEVDNILNPDIVIFSTTERLINPVLTRYADNL